MKSIISYVNLPPDLRKHLESYANLKVASELSESGLQDALDEANIALVVTALDSKHIRMMRKLEFIQSIAAGVDTLPWSDIPRNVIVSNNVGSNADSVAEHTWALILAASKNIVRHATDMRSLKFDRSPESTALNGKVLLVLGLGQIGQRVAKIGKAFGMTVHGINRTGRTEMLIDRCGTLQDLSSFLKLADVVVAALHMNKSTAGIMNSSRLETMKPDALLVNVGRAGLVVKEDLARHLEKNPSFKFASDVWWSPPASIRDDGDILKLENTIGTPWNAGAGASVEVYNKMIREAVESLLQYLRTGVPRNVVARSDYI